MIEYLEIQQNADMSEFLIGYKKRFFLEYLGYKENVKDFLYRIISNHKLFFYLLAIYLPSFFIAGGISRKTWPILLIPISEVFVTIVNRFVTDRIKPRVLPRLKDIDESVNTFVIVPTLLKSKERVKELFTSIEKYYILNKIPNIYFCLLGDVSEEKEELAKHDEEVGLTGQEEVKRLNEKYGKDIFHFAYRKRVYNEKQES